MRTPVIVTAVALLASSVCATAGAQAKIDSAMVGTWEGRAEITVPWTRQRSLAVHLVVQADGAVVGSVGDAQLVDGRLCDPRGPVSHLLRVGRAYSVEGDLTGAIIRDEGVRRDRIHILLDWKSPAFTGELQTSGSPDGPPSEAMLTAARLVLRRVSPGPAPGR